MPKSSKEINSFEAGIILNTSEKDIPQDSASFSLNVDPNAKNGILSGVKTNKLISSVDGNISRVLQPFTWGQDSLHQNNNTTPLNTSESIMIDNVQNFENCDEVSFIGLKGYMETLTIKSVIPHMEKLVASISQLGNTVNSTTYAQYQPTGSGSSDISETDTEIDLSDATTTDDLHDLLREGDYIQFADQATSSGAFKDLLQGGEIMKITSVTADNIKVERGVFGTSSNTYIYSKTYNVWINKISHGGKGLQTRTNIGYFDTIAGFSKISSNHLKGNGSFIHTDGSNELRHVVTGSSDQVVFNADNKTMQLTGNTTLYKIIPAGDTFHYYSSITSNNHGKTFTIKYYNTTTGIFYLKEAPVTETVSSSSSHYFEPSLIKNSLFLHQNGTNIGDSQSEVVNDWTTERYDENVVLVQRNIPSDNRAEEMISAEKNMIFNSASDWVEYSPSSTLGGFGDDGSPEYLEITGTSATSKEGAELGTGYLKLLKAGKTYEISASLWANGGSVNNFKMEVGGVASSAFNITDTAATYTVQVVATSDSALRIYNEVNDTRQWFVDNVSVREITAQRNDTGPYSDANVFGSDLDGDFYPYSTNSSILLESGLIGLTDTCDAISATQTSFKTQTFSEYSYLYVSYGDILKIDNELMRVESIKKSKIYVTRGVHGTTAASHSAGVALSKLNKSAVTQNISKDLIKADTEYELDFWAFADTTQKATATITAVDTTIGNYDEQYFTLISTAGTAKTYWFNHDNSDGATGSVLTNGYVVIQLNGLSGLTNIRDEIEEAIEHANGHNGEITATDSSTDAITLEQVYGGFAGNTIIEKSDGLSTTLLTTTDFQYGISPLGIFSIQYNGGYFDSNGNFIGHKKSDASEGLGSVQYTNIISQNKRWNNFSECDSFDGVQSIEEGNVDSIRWHHLTFKFKTPKELPKRDMKLTIGNYGGTLAPSGTIGDSPTKLAISAINITESTYAVNTSVNTGISANSGIVDNSGVKDLVMYNHNNSKLNFILNFDNKNETATTVTNSVETSEFGATEFNSTNNKATFVNKNRETHIGFGSKKADTPPQWLGYLNTKVFGKETSNLYLDRDSIPEYDAIGVNNIEKVCLAGEWERMAATASSSGTILTIVHEAHGMKNGDNLIVRQYMDTDNSWNGQGVWYVHDASGADALVLKRNTNLDNQPTASSASNIFDTTGDGTLNSTTGYVSYRPYYYYAISRGDRYLLRITPEDRISGATAVDSTNYPMGKIEKSKLFDFPIESICCSYAKNPEDLDSGGGVNTAARDGGHIYALSTYGDRIYRLNVKVQYDVWESNVPTITETMDLAYKSFKWSNSHSNGNIDGTTAVFDSLAEESSPNIIPAGMPSDIIETKGPIATFDWDEEDIGDQDVDPAFFDTRLWLQHYPSNEDGTFKQGDRFLFCAKSEYGTGERSLNFADRTPPTNVLYGTEARTRGSTPDVVKFKAGPFVRANPYSEDITANEDIQDIGKYALFDTHKQGGSGADRIRNWAVYKDFDFETMKPSDIGNKYETYAYSKPYVNFGNNVGWNGTGNKTTAIKVARYGLFAIADNDGDGILDGTGVVIPNNDNYSASEKKYGELHRRMSSHAVGLIGGSDIPWIKNAGSMYGNHRYEYYMGAASRHNYLLLGEETEENGIIKALEYTMDSPELMDASKCVFVCTDIHYGDIANENNKYTISSLAVTGGYAGDLSDHTKYTKVTTSEAHNLQSGDLVYFKGTGGWGGWSKSYYVVAVKDDDEFYVAVDSGTVTGTGEVWVGGYDYNRSGTYTKISAGRGEDHFHYAFNKDEKSDGDIFHQHGAFSRKWYTEQFNVGPGGAISGDGFTTKTLFPRINSNVDRLNFMSGFMIRPFNMDDNDFNKLLISGGLSVDMPSFPDTVYHKGASVKNIGADNIENQFASKLFLSSPGEVNTLGELDDSKVYICEWNFLYPNLSSQTPIAAEGSSNFDTNNTNRKDSREVLGYGAVASYTTTAHASNLSNNQRDAVSHPIVGLTPSSSSTGLLWTTASNAYAGLYISVVDSVYGFVQTRKIIGSFYSGSVHYMQVHYPFGHTLNNSGTDNYYIWSHANAATAPVRLFKSETLRHDNSEVYSKDPVLSGPIYKSNGTATFDGSSAGLITSDSFHNLTTGDLVEIEGTASFNGTHSVTVKTPKIFSISTSASAAAETGTWKLVSENSSASNPLSVPLTAPSLKMSFGDLDKRELRTYTVTDVANTSSTTNTLTTSADHLMETGEKITFVNSDTAAQTGSYIIDDGASSTTLVVETTDTTTATGKTYAVTTNQWGGIGTSSKGSSTIGKLRAGLAQWDKGDMSGNANRHDATDNTRFISAIETSVSLSKGQSSGTDDYFLKNNNYKYKVSLIYDGYQEGPLSSSSWVYNESSTTNVVNATISVKTYSKRLTHVCLYRKDSEDAFYRLVRQIPTEIGWNFDDGAYKYIIQDKGNLKASYEVRTGISELNKDLSIKYGMSAECSGFLFAGDCSHNEIDNASNQVFRSKPGKFSIFDWSVDFVILKSKPTAMVSYLGKLFVFDNNNTYRINPFSLQIEDIFEGVGCSGKDSVVVTEYGMYFANRSGAYFHDGNSPKKISSAIQKGGKTDMLTLSNASSLGTEEIEDLSWSSTAGNPSCMSPYVTFDSNSNTVLFIVEFKNNITKDIVTDGGINTPAVGASTFESSGEVFIWAYSVEKFRWDLWELAKGFEIGAPFLSKDGTPCIPVGNMLLALNKGNNNKQYKWLSKKLIMDTSTNKKVFNKIKIVGPKHSLINDGTFESDSDKLIISTDKGRVTSGSNSTTSDIKYKSTGNNTSDYRLKGSNKTATWVQFKLEEMEEEVDSIGIVYRLRAIK